MQIEAAAEINREHDVVFGLAKDLTLRHAGGFTSIEGDMAAALEAQARKQWRFASAPSASQAGTTASSGDLLRVNSLGYARRSLR